MNTSQIIPYTFKLGANEFYTIYVDNIDDTGLGRSIECLGTIKLTTKWQGFEVPMTSQEKTFFHELLHMILDTLGEKELSSNEKLIDSVSTLLHQYIKENYYLKNTVC
jgi:hypothetical protein